MFGVHAWFWGGVLGIDGLGVGCLIECQIELIFRYLSGLYSKLGWTLAVMALCLTRDRTQGSAEMEVQIETLARIRSLLGIRPCALALTPGYPV